MNNIEKGLADLHTFIRDAEKSNASISSVNVGWHIEHSLLVIIKIIESVTKSDPSKYQWQFNFSRLVVFTLKKFSRGKGDAPDVVKPNQTERTDFDALFQKARMALKDLENTTANNYFVHPVFGNLNRKNTFKMLDIHTWHHLYIIKDIISYK